MKLLPLLSLALVSGLTLASEATALPATAPVPFAQGTTSTFSDIQSNVYQKAILEGAKLGIVQGFPDGTFRPNDPVTREQAVSIIVDAINLLAPVDLAAKPTQPVRPFTDVPSDRWSAAKIAWAQWNLLPAGSPTGTFRPTEYITRADLVSFLRRAAERVKTNLGRSPALTPTQAPIAFTDVSGFNQQLTMQMSAYCQVASPLNEKGTKFAPTQPATRGYMTAALLRMLTCVGKDTQ